MHSVCAVTPLGANANAAVTSKAARAANGIRTRDLRRLNPCERLSEAMFPTCISPSPSFSDYAPNSDFAFRFDAVTAYSLPEKAASIATHRFFSMHLESLRLSDRDGAAQGL